MVAKKSKEVRASQEGEAANEAIEESVHEQVNEGPSDHGTEMANRTVEGDPNRTVEGVVTRSHDNTTNPPPNVTTI